MGRLVATFLASLDLRTEDATGDFAFARPTREVHALVNDEQRAARTMLHGRRLWQTMRVWQSQPDDGSIEGDYGRIWRDATKVVFSASLPDPAAPRVRLERRFEPQVVRDLVAAAPHDVSIGGAALAASAFRAGLVDELRLYLAPVVVGSGPRAIPDDVALALDLQAAQRLHDGWVRLAYRVRRDDTA